MPESVVLADLSEVASLWKLALVATVAFLGWLYRGALRTLIQTGSLRLRRGQIEVEMRPAAEAPPSVTSEPEEEPPPDRPTSIEEVGGKQSRPDAAERDEESNRPTIANLIDQLEAGDRDGADAIFEALQSEEEDEDARLRNTVFYAYSRAVWSGDATALKDLEGFTQVDSVSSFAYRLNGLVHERASNFDQAIACFESAVASATDLDSRLLAISSLAGLLFSTGREDDALSGLTAELPDLTPRERVPIYDALADLHSRKGDFLAQALALEETLDMYPTSAKRQFDTAYAYAHADRQDLALLHYSIAVRLDPTHEAALNNLGVAYELLLMPIKAVANYKRAFEQGNTLAAANLSTRYVNAGFADDARDLLGEAAATESPHENVAEKIAELNTAVETQTRREEEVKAKAERRRQFLRKYAEAFFMPSDPHDLSGEWILDDSIHVQATQTETSVKMTYESNGSRREFRGNLMNNALDLERFTERPPSALYPNSAFKPDGVGRGVCTQDRVELFFEEDGGADQVFTLRRGPQDSGSEGDASPEVGGDTESKAREAERDPNG